MKVYKFGGASVNGIENIKNVASILEKENSAPLMVVVSAMGKTTNALEKVVAAFFEGRKEEALDLFETIKNEHLLTAKTLLVNHYAEAHAQLVNCFTEAEWLLHDRPVRNFDYYYDQLVCIGELLSTCIVSAYLKERGIANHLLDVRDVLRTDTTFRDAAVDWTETARLLNEADLFSADKGSETELSTTIVLTQGFIGSTTDNESTTLGREGSDYTAAIFANLLQAESLTIWKDVEGVMSADPKVFFDAEFISLLSYREVIEMAFYGAQVIHPKTIKPLQNKGIQLVVRSFLQPDQPGTVIGPKSVKYLPPIKILKQHQVLVELQSKDFSFVVKQGLQQLFTMFDTLHIQPNLVQTGAVSLQLCVDDHAEKIDQLAAMASGIFNVHVKRGLTLLTIRHYGEELLTRMTEGKSVELVQKTKETVQVVYS